MRKSECSSWAGSLGKALESAMSSAVAEAYGQPELTLDEYAFAVANADRDISQLMRSTRYSVRFRLEPNEAVRLICERPEVAAVLGDKGEADEFALQGLRSGYTKADQREFALAIIARLVCSATLSGVPETVRRFEDVLERSAAKDLPGWEATFISGLNLEGRWDIAEGLFALPYDEYRREHLRSMAAPIFDFMLQRAGNVESSVEESPITVILQEIRWGPAVAAGFGSTEIMYPGFGGKAVDVASLVNLLSVIGDLRLRIAGQEARAERWFYDLFGHGLDLGMNHFVRSPVELVSGEGKELLPEHKAEFERLAPLCLTFEETDRPRIDLAVSRLAGALSRTGSLADEDRILDVAIALEILYAMPERTRLSERTGRFLGSTPDERAGIESMIDRFYESRVAIVHGLRREADRDSMTGAFSEGLDIAKRTVKALLERGSMLSRTDWKLVERAR